MKFQRSTRKLLKQALVALFVLSIIIFGTDVVSALTHKVDVPLQEQYSASLSTDEDVNILEDNIYLPATPREKTLFAHGNHSKRREFPVCPRCKLISNSGAWRTGHCRQNGKLFDDNAP